jgi:chromate transporter
MKTDLLSQIAATFATMSLAAIGGANAILPEMHHEVVTVQSWMDDTTFANLFAIAQTAPGPNVMIVSLIGWHLAGPAGLAVATLAICLPSSLLTFTVSRLRRRLLESSGLKLVQQALMPIPIGLMAASGAIMAGASDHSASAVLMTLAATLFVGFSRYNPLWILAIGGLSGIIGFAFFGS